MKYTFDELVAMAESPYVKQIRTSEKYAVCPIEAGGKYHISFEGGQEHFLYVSLMPIQLFCHNLYLPAIHVIKSEERNEVSEIYLRANAVVFTDKDCYTDYTIYPISAVADIIWERPGPSSLRKHF